jgi:hypothetical protein
VQILTLEEPAVKNLAIGREDADERAGGERREPGAPEVFERAHEQRHERERCHE